MSQKVLHQEFFNRKTETVAKELLGKFLIRRVGDSEITALITETEAYIGPHDKAAHSFKGRTQRTEVMFGHPGVFYIYLCYGIHWMLNIVTREYGYPAAVLIRGVMVEGKKYNGPGKITKLLQIDKKLNSQKATPENGLWVEDRGVKVPQKSISAGPRVGVAYAGPIWAQKPLRFVLKDTPR